MNVTDYIDMIQITVLIIVQKLIQLPRTQYNEHIKRRVTIQHNLKGQLV